MLNSYIIPVIYLHSLTLTISVVRKDSDTCSHKRRAHGTSGGQIPLKNPRGQCTLNFGSYTPLELCCFIDCKPETAEKMVKKVVMSKKKVITFKIVDISKKICGHARNKSKYSPPLNFLGALTPKFVLRRDIHPPKMRSFRRLCL